VKFYVQANRSFSVPDSNPGNKLATKPQFPLYVVEEWFRNIGE